MRLCKLALALGVAALLASPALAQRGGRGGPFGGGAQLLENNKSVQEELKMDKDQIDKVKEALAKVREDHKDDIAKLRDRDTPMEERMEIGRKIGEANTKAIAGILKPEQEKRWKQMQHQMQGVGMFNDAEVQKTLSLTDDQKDKIKTINEDLQKERRELFQGGAGGDFQEMRKKMEAMNKEAMNKAKSVLTADQKKTLDNLTGKPFELKMEFPPRRGGGAGGAGR
jgi:Spy/CpxP family protein refolding chaperone